MVATLLGLALALAPVLGALARTHEAVDQLAAAQEKTHFHAALHGATYCHDHAACDGAQGGDGGGLHQLTNAVDCCAHVVATLPVSTASSGVPPGSAPLRLDDAAMVSLSSQPLLEPPIR